jgi:hypothetical protein
VGPGTKWLAPFRGRSSEGRPLSRPKVAGLSARLPAMKVFVVAVGLSCFWGCAVSSVSRAGAPSSGEQPTAESIQSLVGTWTVDLRASPDGEPYTKPFIVERIDASTKSFTGSFYDSEISWSRINTAWGKVVLSFITSDGQGEYVHTCTLQGEQWVGSSTAKHRNMLVPWTAVRNSPK